MRCKTPVAPHGRSLQATGNAAARPSVWPECSSYYFSAPKGQPDVIHWLKPSGSHFDQAVRAYSAQLYQYAMWLCRDRHHAEDIVQEAFARAWKHWDQVRDEGGRRSWLYTIVRNEFLRHNERSAAAPDQIDDEDVKALMDERDFTIGLEVRQALDRLPAQHLEPLLLQSLAGMTCEEIALVLGVSVAATMTRLTRARIALRGLLDESSSRQTISALRVVRIGDKP
jgi:RNA polymerase sigma-70 factor (ECF subfamily)